MTLFGKTIETQKFYVVEVVNGNEIRVTRNFTFLADADAALSRMKKGDPAGNYVVKTV